MLGHIGVQRLSLQCNAEECGLVNLIPISGSAVGICD